MVDVGVLRMLFTTNENIELETVVYGQAPQNIPTLSYTNTETFN